MGQDSKIEWCHHTFNPWVGCTRVSDGCKFCYAENMMDARYGKVKWGPKGTRMVKADSGWRDPIKWNRLAKEAGEIHRVFCASLADVGEGEDTMPEESWPIVQAARARLVETFDGLTNLRLLLLTKRPENMPRLFPAEFLARHHVGTSVENQKYADERILHLLKCPAAVRFLSVEPMLGPIDFGKVSRTPGAAQDEITDADDAYGPPLGGVDGIDWIIAGGESGPHARSCDVDWIQSIVDQCRAASVPCFVKQLGKRPFTSSQPSDRTKRFSQPGEFIDGAFYPDIFDPKGGDISEFPESLRVREFPTVLKTV